MSKRHKKTGKGKKQPARQQKNKSKQHSIPKESQSPVIKGDHTLRFSAVDTLFFRESRPMESIGGSELSSVFPPPTRTLVGSIRTLIGERENVNWKEYAQQKAQHPLAQIIGYGDDLGSLTFKGPWLTTDKERLYPAPLNLMQNETQIKFLSLSQPRHCDLGKAVRLPSLPANFSAAKPLENHWISRNTFEQILQGQAPTSGKVIPKNDLVTDEARLGIALDSQTRTVEEQMLYQTKHIRLKNTSVEIDISGLDIPLQDTPITRLGGEGRMASLEATTTPALPKAPANPTNTHGLILYLLTPARFSENSTQPWHPLPGFTKQETSDPEATTWKGEINGIALTLHSAVTGKAIREGGWDMANHLPRAVQSLIPAGSCWYLTVDDKNINAAIQALHGTHIGDDQNIGRGQVITGLWQKQLLEN